MVLFLAGCTQDFSEEYNNKPNFDDTLEFSKSAYFTDIIGSEVLFLDNKSEPSKAGKEILNSQASWLLKSDDYLIVIEGHTDEKGTRDYNLSLGAKRASVIKDFYILNGIEEAKITIITYGKERPKYVCSSDECHSKNRRTITILKSQ